MTPVWWLQLSEADLRRCDGWLAAAEKRRAERLRVPKRRAEWLLGRWTAKHALASFLNLSPWPETLASIDLVAGPDGAPIAMLPEGAAPASFSISHRAGLALCAVGPSGHAVGCDIEQIEPHSDNFIADYFTTEEREHLAYSDAAYASVIWSAKEAVLKVLHAGLRLDTRSVSVRLIQERTAGGWYPFRAEYVNGAMFRGWWQTDGDLVRTVSAFPPPMPPLAMNTTGLDTADLNNLPSGKIRAQHACRP
jgi:4'-phosphopantetheinyl transferase